MSHAAASPPGPLAAKIAVVDDERRLRELLELSLAHHGFLVESAAEGQAALALAQRWRPDLIVLDVMLPKIDGISLLPMLRRITQAPIIMLSAKGELEDKIAGLTQGADDYISKPFELPELIARIRSALRRPTLESRTVLVHEDLHVDLDTHDVVRDGMRLDLSPLEYATLVALMRHPRQILTREQLLDLVWGTDAEVGANAVERCISYLRAKIDEGFAKRLIHTVRGAGYTLRAD